MPIKLREYSVEIVELFEELLDKHDITIPDEDREGNEDEARLYGMTYWNLEDRVIAVLNDLVTRIQNEPSAEIDSYNL